MMSDERQNEDMAADGAAPWDYLAQWSYLVPPSSSGTGLTVVSRPL